MSKPIANVNPTIDTFESWVNTTNLLADVMTTSVVTTSANSIGATTVANAYVNGIFSANVLVATQTLRGGTVASSGNLVITSNASITGANLYSNATNIQLVSNTTTLTANTLLVNGITTNVTSNFYVKGTSLTVLTSGRIGVNTAVANVALEVSGDANISANLAVGGATTLTGNVVHSSTTNLALAGAETTGYVHFGNSANYSFGFNGTQYVLSSNADITMGGATGTLTVPALSVGTIAATANITMGANAFFVGNVAGTSNTCSRTITLAYSSNAAANSQQLITGAGTLTSDLTITLTSAAAATANTLVARDANTNFSANTITASLNGTAAGANTLLYNSAQRSATDAATGNSIMARDAGGNTSATFFVGTATSARFADLAERYLADDDYPVGTVVVVGGTQEVTASSHSGQRALGVVSENPAFRMNEDLAGGTFIALKGRVPVKVYGPVRKGDGLIAGPVGTASAALSSTTPGVFAIALQGDVDTHTRLVEAVVL